MTPRLPHWLAAGGLALAAHFAAFAPLDVDKRSAAEQSAGTPEAVWGLSEIALTETAEPQTREAPVEPLEQAEIAEPRESAALRAIAPSETAPVAVPETPGQAETAETAEQVASETAEAAEAETAEPVEETQAREPVEEPVERPLKKPEKPEAKKETASGGPVGRAAGREGSSNSAGSAGFSNYAGRVAAHLRRYKRYPSNAGRARGTVRVSFAVSRSGALRSVRIVSGSGTPALDRAALKMVRRAAPFPRMPSNINRGSASFSVPIRFSR